MVAGSLSDLNLPRELSTPPFVADLIAGFTGVAIDAAGVDNGGAASGYALAVTAADAHADVGVGDARDAAEGTLGEAGSGGTS